jgi:hydrophobe/amphiphile efflux-1 (HAE1) family protein
MFISDTSIDRPVMAVMLIGALVVFGVISVNLLPVRQLPDVDPPVVNIQVPFPGANPEVVEKEVTEPIEENVNTIQGIKRLESISGSGGAQIIAEFTLDRDIDVATQDVRDKVNSIRGELPGSEQIEEPIIEKVNPDEDPVMWISVNSEFRDQIELSVYADRELKPQLERLEGVGRVRLGGLRGFSVRVWLDPKKLASYNLTVEDVRNALLTQNQELPSGRIEGEGREFTIRTEGDIQEIEQFNKLIVANRQGTQIQLEDVGVAKRGARDTRTVAHFTKPGEYVGRNNIGLGIVRQTGSNTVAVVNRVKERLEEMKENAPPAITLQIASDDSRFIQESINNLMEHLLFGGLLAAFVVFLFLASGRPGLITIISIPTSIISSFSVMYFLGFSLNNLTMLAMVLAVGIVVDDSVVVMENIFRHKEEGKGTLQAARDGAAEIAFAVLSASASVVVVFMPLLFVTGVVGQFFMEFSLAVAGAIFVSYLVSLSVIPMLASRYLSEGGEEGWFYQFVHGTMDRVANGYSWMLTYCLKARWVFLIIAVLVGWSTWLLFQYEIGKELQPKTDQSQFLIFMEAPQGSTLEYTSKYLAEVEQIMADQPEVRTMFSAVGLATQGFGQPDQGIAFVRMKPIEERREQGLRSQQELMRDLRGKLAQVPGLLAFPTSGSQGISAQGKPLQMVIQANDLDQLSQASEEIQRRLRQQEGIVDVDSDLDLDKPKVRVVPDRKRAADLGIPLTRIADTLRVLMGGDDVTEFEREGERYDVMLQLRREDRSIPDQISQIYLRSNEGKRVPLSSVVSVEEFTGADTINHFNRSRAVTIEANTQNLPLQEAVTTAQRIARDVGDEQLKGGFDISLTGQSQDMQEMFENFIFIFVLAVIVIYMLLAGQFDHFVHPFTIMVSLPFALFGSLGFLWLMDFTINLYSIIGMLMLSGIILRNAILLVDYANLAQRNMGMDRFEAVVEAGRVRLRPILMTGLSTIGGVFPTLLGLGSGSELQRPLAAAVIGGMIAGNLLTLFFVPVVYTYLGQLTDFALWITGRLDTEIGPGADVASEGSGAGT